MHQEAAWCENRRLVRGVGWQIKNMQEREI